jgi:hypothetical protein
MGDHFSSSSGMAGTFAVDSVKNVGHGSIGPSIRAKLMPQVESALTISIPRPTFHVPKILEGNAWAGKVLLHVWSR